MFQVPLSRNVTLTEYSLQYTIGTLLTIISNPIALFTLFGVQKFSIRGNKLWCKIQILNTLKYA